MARRASLPASHRALRRTAVRARARRGLIQHEDSTSRTRRRPEAAVTTFVPAGVVDAFDFRGRVVVVTGASRGIGRAIAERFLSCGAEVMASGRSEIDDERLP